MHEPHRCLRNGPLGDSLNVKGNRVNPRGTADDALDGEIAPVCCPMPTQSAIGVTPSSPRSGGLKLDVDLRDAQNRLRAHGRNLEARLGLLTEDAWRTS